MASFDININNKPVISYVAKFESFQKNNCSVLNQTIPVGVINKIEVPGILFLLKEYINVSDWKTLRIYNAVYSKETSFYYEYNGVKIPQYGVDPNVLEATVDIESVLDNESIPLLTLVLDNHTLTSNETAYIDITIEDVSSQVLGRITVGFNLIAQQCPAAVNVKPITPVSSVTNSCYTESVVTVKVPAGSSRYVSVLVAGGFGTISGGSLPATITSDTTYTLKIDAATGASNPIYSTVQLFVKLSSSSGTTLGSTIVRRNHTGNIC